MKSVRLFGAAGLLCLAALFFISCEVPTAPEPATPPAAPEEPPVITDYERYAIYLVAPDGSIDYEEHCADTWEPAYYSSVEEYFGIRRNGIYVEAMARGAGWQCISGRIYTPPKL